MKKMLLALLLISSQCFAENLNGTIWEGVGVKTTQATTTSTIINREFGNVAVHRTILIFTASPVVLTNNAGVALYGGIGTTTTTAVYTFPKGNIIIYGAEIRSGTSALTCSSAGSASFASIMSLGTVTSANDATLTGTEANILASASNPAAAAKVVGSIKNISLAAPVAPIDGTTTAVPMFLNLVIANDASNASGTCTFTGTVTVTWSNLTNN